MFTLLISTTSASFADSAKGPKLQELQEPFELLTRTATNGDAETVPACGRVTAIALFEVNTSRQVLSEFGTV